MTGPVGLPSGPDKKWKVPLCAIWWLAVWAWAVVVTVARDVRSAIGKRK